MISYASNHRNRDTISIECCHPDDTGQFYDSTYQSLVELTAYLCRQLKLEPSAVIRHHDVTGKMCPKYLVDNWDMWKTFLDDIKQKIEINAVADGQIPEGSGLEALTSEEVTLIQEYPGVLKREE